MCQGLSVIAFNSSLLNLLFSPEQAHLVRFLAPHLKKKKLDEKSTSEQRLYLYTI